MKTTAKLSPYDLWKDKADLANKYRDGYKHREGIAWSVVGLLVVSIALNTYLLVTLC